MVSPIQGPFEFCELKLPKHLNRQCLDNRIPVFLVNVQVSILFLGLKLIRVSATQEPLSCLTDDRFFHYSPQKKAIPLFMLT
jgi:hypothetical protein